MSTGNLQHQTGGFSRLHSSVVATHTSYSALLTRCEEGYVQSTPITCQADGGY